MKLLGDSDGPACHACGREFEGAVCPNQACKLVRHHNSNSAGHEPNHTYKRDLPSSSYDRANDYAARNRKATDMETRCAKSTEEPVTNRHQLGSKQPYTSKMSPKSLGEWDVVSRYVRVISAPNCCWLTTLRIHSLPRTYRCPKSRRAFDIYYSNSHRQVLIIP